MTARLTPAIKGLITAVLMIALSLFIAAKKDSINLNVQYLVYVLYAAGISWTLIDFINRSGSSGFNQLFSQGFKCFIVVTLVMVVFTAIFIKTHPELAEQERQATIEYYQKEGNKTQQQIEAEGNNAKKHYLLGVVSLSVPKYLLIGAASTVVLSLFLSRRKN